MAEGQMVDHVAARDRRTSATELWQVMRSSCFAGTHSSSQREAHPETALQRTACFAGKACSRDWQGSTAVTHVVHEQRAVRLIDVNVLAGLEAGAHLRKAGRVPRLGQAVLQW